MNLMKSIVSYVKKEYNLMIGERTAEDIKIRIGSAFKDDQEETMQIRGRDLISGLTKNCRNIINWSKRSIKRTYKINNRCNKINFRKNTTRISIRYNGKWNNVNWRGSIT